MSVVFDGVAANNLDLGGGRNYLRNVAGGTFMGWVTLGALTISRVQICVTVGPSTSTRAKTSILSTGAVELRARALDGEASSSTVISGAGVIATDQRYHIASVFDFAARSGYIYVNGDLITTGVFSAMTAGNTSDTAALTGTIGANEPGTGAPWIGQMEDVRVYGRALGPSEIKTIATGRGADGFFGDLQGRWLLNEKPAGQTVDLIADLSPNAYGLVTFGTVAYAGSTIVSRRSRRPAVGRR